MLTLLIYDSIIILSLFVPSKGSDNQVALMDSECGSPCTNVMHMRRYRVWALFKGRVKFVHHEREDGCQNNSRVGSIQGNRVI